MIKHFNEHAANERTLLAWVRTSLAVSGFGFLMEKFELFITKVHLSSRAEDIAASPMGRFIGLGLVATGMVMMLFSVLRYLIIQKRIETQAEKVFSGFPGLVLPLILMGIVILVMLYLGLQLAG